MPGSRARIRVGALLFAAALAAPRAAPGVKPLNLSLGPGIQVMKVHPNGRGGLIAAGVRKIPGKPHEIGPNGPFFPLDTPTQDITGTTQIVLAAFDTGGDRLFQVEMGGSGTEEVRALTTDPQGDVYLAGASNSSDWEVTRRYGDPPQGLGLWAFVARLSAAGELRWLTALSGAREPLPSYKNARDPFALIGSRANALALDPAGNIYVTGGTTAGDFAVTPGAFSPPRPPPPSGGFLPFPDDLPPGPILEDVFVAKLDPSGQLAYSSRFGGTGDECSPDCVGNAGLAIVADVDGGVVVAGRANSRQFPTTPGAFQTVCDCKAESTSGFVLRLDPSGAKLEWSTLIGGKPIPRSQAGLHFYYGGVEVRGVALGQDGAVVIGGTAHNDFPVTFGVLQPEPPHPTILGEFSWSADLFLARLEAEGRKLAFGTYYGAPGKEEFGGMVVGADGSLWLSGINRPKETYDNPGSDARWRGAAFLTRISPDGTREISRSDLPEGIAGRGLLADGPSQLLSFGKANLALRLPAEPVPAPLVYGIVNLAGTVAQSVVSPGEAVRIWGSGLAGVALAAEPDAAGFYPRSLGGVQVLFDGAPAPLLAVSPERIDAVAPFALRPGETTLLEVRTQEGITEPVALQVVGANPAIVMSSYSYAAAIGPRGIPDYANPTWPGEVITVWVAGAGAFHPALQDGDTAFRVDARPVLPVRVVPGYEFDPLLPEILYAGPAPGMVAGILQINMRIRCTEVHPWVTSGPPSVFTPGMRYAVEIGEFRSPTVLFALNPSGRCQK